MKGERTAKSTFDTDGEEQAMILTPELVQRDLDSLPANAKTAEIDRLICRYVKEKADASPLRDVVLQQLQFHRIYFYVSLKQIKGADNRLKFIHENLLFCDWWCTDSIIRFVAKADFDTALSYAKEYIHSDEPYTRRWGYVMFISKLGHGRAEELLPLINDDAVYHVQMAEGWLIAELAVFQPEVVFNWMASNGLSYAVNGKAIQKICDSYRISDQWKAKFKSLRPSLRLCE